jgi:hypothetical protein
MQNVARSPCLTYKMDTNAYEWLKIGNQRNYSSSEPLYGMKAYIYLGGPLPKLLNFWQHFVC